MSQANLEIHTSHANTLPIGDLRAKLRNPKTQPICWNCDKHHATDVHHLDGNHQNNDPANLAPWCKRCHNDYHDISDNLTDLGLAVRQLYAIQKQRVGMSNRLRAYQVLGYEPRHSQEILDDFVKLEKHAAKLVADMVKREPIYQAYLQHIRGVGPALSSILISEIADPGRFPTISSLWAYSGLDVNEDGQARKRRKGEKANWNTTLRTTCAKKLTDQFIKLRGCFGRQLYDQYKTFYTARDGDDLSKGHIDNRARRKVAKVFLSCLWVAWRELKDLPISLPYAFDRLEGHTHIVTPKDWMENGNDGEFVWMEEFPIFQEIEDWV